jgi:3-deoxy-D-manno-octulosonate 8-phosphate phosphatase (KDO 8-P phosphatase)
VSVGDVDLASIKALVMDVDGVLTDGTFLWSASGEESKRFSFEDVMGLSRARRAGLALGLISGEDSPLVDRFAEKVGISSVVKGCKEKGIALQDFSKSMEIPLQHIAYMGDDVNDLTALAIAGLGVAPANAQASVKAAAGIVLVRRGGEGAVRELIEMLMAARAPALQTIDGEP